MCVCVVVFAKWQMSAVRNSWISDLELQVTRWRLSPTAAHFEDYRRLWDLNKSNPPSIHYLYTNYALRVTGDLEPIPADIGWEAYHRANIQGQTTITLTVTPTPPACVWTVGRKLGYVVTNQCRHRGITQKGPGQLNSKWGTLLSFLMWGDSADHININICVFFLLQILFGFNKQDVKCWFVSFRGAGYFWREPGLYA